MVETVEEDRRRDFKHARNFLNDALLMLADILKMLHAL